MKLTLFKRIGITSAILVGTVGGLVSTSNAESKSNIDRSTITSTNPILTAQATTNNFVSAGGYQTNGTVKIVEENGKKYLEFSSNFTTSNGPALEVILHRNSKVADSIESSDYVKIAKLNSTKGSQRYLIPDTIDLSNYSSVAIWCERFNVTFGYSSI